MTGRSVFVVSDFFLPGYKAGGPVRSLAALVDANLDGTVRVLTRDRDLGDRLPYEDVPVRKWVPCGSASVMYLPSGHPGSIVRAWREIRRGRPSCVYLNSLFAPTSGLLPIILWKCGLLGHTRLVVAPRGQLDAGALTLSARRKRIVLRLLLALRLLDRIRWHATSADEADRIRKIVGTPADVVVLPPLPDATFRTRLPSRPHRPLRLVFISRISPKKGLLVALEALKHVSEPLRFDVYGPEDDAEYARKCHQTAADIPSQHRVQFHGPLSHSDVSEVLETADAFVLPTLGENFGHAIFEALAAGCPVVIGEGTPWGSAMALGAGLLVNPLDPLDVASAIETLALDAAESWQERSEAAVAAATAYCGSTGADSNGWERLFWEEHPEAP